MRPGGLSPHRPSPHLMRHLILASALVSLASTSFAQSSPRISVGRNVQLSTGLPHHVHSEILGEAHSSNPNHMLVCSIVFDQKSDATGVAAYITKDGGDR